MTELSLHSMTQLLTKPYRRGAETLVISLGNDLGGWTDIIPYDFREYKARYQSEPADTRYIIFPKQDIGRDGVLIELVFSVTVQTTLSGAIDVIATTISVAAFTGFPPNGQFTIRVDDEVMTVTAVNATTWTVVRGIAETIATAHGSGATVTQIFLLPIPPLAIAHTSFAIPLPAEPDATLRLSRFRQLSLALTGTGADNWGIVALLGNIAKLLWAIGNEKDAIHWHLKDIQQQRYRPLAHGFSLDKLGEDLRVPRFPPREYSFDENTLALYHLNDVSDSTVLDEITQFPRPGVTAHSGNNLGAQKGVTGKFGTGFKFPGATGSGAIEIPHHVDFDLPSDHSFTVEVFIKPDAVNSIQVAIAKGQQDVNGIHTAPGWSLSLGTFRGIDNNVRFCIADSSNRVEIFADISIADAQFHHLAGEIDRTGARSRLFVDGEELATASIRGLAAVNNSEPIRIGRGTNGNQFFGVLDEIRLSKVARTNFHPVLGEGDAPYRQRLSIFEHWQLPTPTALLATINKLVQINDQTDSFVLIEKDPPIATVSRIVRIIPATLPVNKSIDLNGGMQSQESEISGTPGAETDFDPIYLLRHDRPNVDYGTDENHHRMQANTKQALDALLDLLVAMPGLIIDKSFDPDQGLHRVGRALLLRHLTLSLEQLGVYAHRAGFDFVKNQGTQIYASVAVGEKLEILTVPLMTLAPGIDGWETRQLDLLIAPASLPANGTIQWTLIVCGAGRAHPIDRADLHRPRLRLIADAPGELTVKVEYTLNHRTVTGTRTLRIGIESLADGVAIAADGTKGLSEAEAVGTEETFNPVYLITHNVAGVNYGSDPKNQQMQIGLEKPLNRLITLLAGSLNGLQIIKAYDPAVPGLHRVGRALRLRHSVVATDRLGALAHQAGFGFVQRQGSDIYCAVGVAAKIDIVRTSDSTSLNGELTVGSAINLQIRPTIPATAGGIYNWSLDAIGYGKGSFASVLRPQVKFTPLEPGFLVLNATYLQPDNQSTLPYTFEIRLKPALDTSDTKIPKDKYDLIMNILNYFHPIGVEVITKNIRDHVVELQGNLQNVFPEYTYPSFHF